MEEINNKERIELLKKILSRKEEQLLIMKKDLKELEKISNNDKKYIKYRNAFSKESKLESIEIDILENTVIPKIKEEINKLSSYSK